MASIGTEDEATVVRAKRGAGMTRTSWLLVGVAILALLGGGAVLARAIDETPDNDSVEAGFLRDMSVHHSQAVEMAFIVRDRTEDEQLRFLATDIILAQQSEIGMMEGWLRVWDVPLSSSDPPMTWMGHAVDGTMPGMATPEQVEQLRTLPVDQAEVLFLQLMIRHHQSAIDMAQAYLDRGNQENVEAFAGNVLRVQQNEINTMNQMLEARGEQPITGSMPMDGEGN